MYTKEVIADIIQSEGGLCVLDKIYLPFPHKNNKPAAKFGLGAELYMPDIDRAELRERVIRFMADYCQTFPGKVDQFLPRGKRRTVKFSGDPTSKVLADFERLTPEDGYGSLLLGAVNIGLQKDYIDPYQAHILVCRPRERELSFISSTFPVCTLMMNSDGTSMITTTPYVSTVSMSTADGANDQAFSWY
ncbi:MAG: hypothetical protein P8101_20870 [Candidatus Thiodiazotropha sp.]